ncbi:MAG: hypothetical protein RL685_3107 [Pseudomonadota bacterium]|jgi:acetyl esterase/lipase
MDDRTSSKPKPRAPFVDCLRVVLSSISFLLLAVLRRLMGQRRRPGWSLRLEAIISAYRGSWSVMPELGLVRWRNVGDAMSPLQTDGLPPRFVRLGSGPREIEGVWLEPPAAGAAVLLYFHGGGFAFASLRTHGPLIGALARAAGARTLAFDYRLAPEHPTPAALEDALAAYRYLLAQEVPPQRIVLAGDSAGGTLVLTTLLALRDAGEPLPAAGVALSPWVDLDCSGASFQTNAAFDFVGEEHCRLAAAAYLAGADPRRADLSPLFAELHGLPPLLVHVGEAEVLRDQIHSFVERAKSAGADVELALYPDMVHVWHMMRSATPDAQRAIDEVGAFVRKHAG